ncbi:NUDIX domain-containing protein [Georgenia sp. 10Sc9-8]|uniref:NUDIX domain-containing protein n=1 Tax=Georgenia halotolerans TaxID=3028317 RepID=A0ABT5TXI3_9MICO|nr:NUDIX domain-containing protein [Georgenia halotolerans]
MSLTEPRPGGDAGHPGPLGDDGLTYGLGPEWRPGDDGVPYRRAARVIVLDAHDRMLLVRGHDAGDVGRTWWFTVGGGLAGGETAPEGAVRELREETGLELPAESLEGPVLARSAVFDFARVTCRQDEEFFLARLPGTADLTDAGWTSLERDVLDELRWWELDALDRAVAAGTTVYPRTLVPLVRNLLTGWDGTTAELDEW